MARVFTSSVISAPIDRVWEHIRDFNALPRWNPNVTESTIEDGLARRRPVTLGQRSDGRVEVVDGLASGEIVARAGTQRLRDGIAVHVPGAAEPSA